MSESISTAVWVIFSGRPASETKPEAKAYFAPFPSEEVEPWRSVTTPGGSALFSHEPGSEGHHDMPLAEKLSHKGVVALWWTATDTLLEFDNGRERSEPQRALVDWLREHGVEEEDDDELLPTPDVTSVAVFVGMEAEAVAKLFTQDGIEVSSGPVGAIVRHTKGQASFAAKLVSKKVGRTAHVITITRTPQEPFLVEIIQGDKSLGFFGDVLGSWPGMVILDDVLGEREPRRILSKLGLSDLAK